MKNIHILPTDKPSRLSDCHNNKLHLDDVRYLKNYLNIYITSDEEIKEGDWFLNKISMKPYKHIWDDYFNNIGEEKIILTTDQDLIKDGVQAIDDELLEWFVKNPSCESVEVEEKEVFVGFIDANRKKPIFDDEYKIIIPKEEPKQVGIDWSGFPKSTQEKVGYVETKQETLEEAANNYSSNELSKLGFINGAKWQQERMYSEEKVLEILNEFSEACHWPIDSFEIPEWLEKIKKEIIT